MKQNMWMNIILSHLEGVGKCADSTPNSNIGIPIPNVRLQTKSSQASHHPLLLIYLLLWPHHFVLVLISLTFPQFRPPSPCPRLQPALTRLHIPLPPMDPTPGKLDTVFILSPSSTYRNLIYMQMSLLHHDHESQLVC